MRNTFNSLKSKSKIYIKPEVLTVILIGIIGCLTLFVKPIIGMADNGDFYRIISQNDLYSLELDERDKLLGYFNKDYGIYKYSHEAPKVIISTQSIFIQVAKALDEIFIKNFIFDIRFLAGILLILHSFAGYLLVKVFVSYIKENIYKYLIAILYVVIFCDTGYLAYFNSFYGEGVIIAAFLLSLGILLYMVRFNKINVINIALFSIFSFLFFGAKQQLSPIGFLVALLLFRIMALNKKKMIKIVSGFLGVFFILSAIVLYKSIKGEFDYINRFHAMTRGVLLNEEEPEKILKYFGIDGSYSLLQEEIYFESIPSINPDDIRLREEFYSNYSIGKILKYYLTHPKSFSKVIKMGMRNSYYIRPEAMGNFEKSEGKPYKAKSYFFVPWSTFKDNIIPKNPIFTVLYFIAYFIISFKGYIRAIKGKNISRILMEESYIYVFLAGFSQVIISVIGAGDADLTKHVFLFNLTFDLMFINAIVYFVRNKRRVVKR